MRFLSVVMETSHYHLRVWIITHLNLWKIIFQKTHSSLLYYKCVSHSNANNVYYCTLHSFQWRSDPIDHNFSHATLWRHCSQTWHWMFLKFCTYLYMQNAYAKCSNLKIYQVSNCYLEAIWRYRKRCRGGQKMSLPHRLGEYFLCLSFKKRSWLLITFMNHGSQNNILFHYSVASNNDAAE